MRRKWATSGLRPLMLNAAFKNSGPLHAGCDCNRKENVVPVSTGSLFWQSSTVQFRMILILASNKVQFRTIFIQTSNKVQFMTIIIQTGNKVPFTCLATAFIITICSPSHSNGLFFSPLLSFETVPSAGLIDDGHCPSFQGRSSSISSCTSLLQVINGMASLAFCPQGSLSSSSTFHIVWDANHL